MPCDRIQTVNVEWSQKSTDLNLLAVAINATDPQAQAVVRNGVVYFQGGTFSNGQFSYQSTYYSRVTQASASDQVAKIKRAYGAEVVKAQAKKFGWSIKQTAPFEFEVMKR